MNYMQAPEPPDTKQCHTLLKFCRVEWQGDFFVVHAPHERGCGTRAVYREHRMFCFIEDAWLILTDRNVNAKWKTLGILIILRQALRERWAQMMPLDEPQRGASRKEIIDFLRIARHYDAIHHGAETF